MIYIGKVKVINTFYKIFIHRDYKEINEMSKSWDKMYDQNYEDKKIDGVSGYCLVTQKEIHLYDGFGPEYNDNTLRHELWHALLYEIGYSHWNDEDLIEKLTVWHPLMLEIFCQGKGMIENARVKEEPRSTQNSEACISDSK